MVQRQVGLITAWMLENMTTQDARTGPTLDPELPETEAPAPLRAVHTPNFPALSSLDRTEKRPLLLIRNTDL